MLFSVKISSPISSVKTEKIIKPFQRKNIYRYIYCALFGYIYRSWLFHLNYKYQLNSQSMGRSDKRRAARDSRFVV